MKPGTLTCTTTMTLFAAIAAPLQLTAQEQQTGVTSRLATLSTSKSVGHRQPAAPALASLPPDGQAGISAALGRDLPAYQARAHAGGFEAENARDKLAAAFTSEGVTLRSGSVVWRLALRGYGYGDSLNGVLAAVPQASWNRVEYRRGPLTEWYVNGPLGLEQGFTINQPPARANPRPRGQPLAIALALSGNLTAALDADRKGCTLTGGDGQARLRYMGLAARDATGSPLRAWLEVQGQRLLLKVDDGKARYPVVVDPWVQLAKLHASDGGADDYLGFSVAIDGDTVVIGANVANTASNAEQGAAYVFVKPPSGWANMTETAKLTASDAAALSIFGWSVAISGNTVVVGAVGAGATYPTNLGIGAAYVFFKPASGWADMTETAKLTASDGAVGDLLGSSVAISGNTVVAGAYQGGGTPGPGAAYVFVEPVGGWANMTQTAKLTASDAAVFDALGQSVSISGNTVVAGAPNATTSGLSQFQGALYIFVEPPTGWSDMTQTAKLTASIGEYAAYLGTSVVIGGDTVVAGAPGTGAGRGAAYVFVEPASGWANMTEIAELAGGAEGDELGFSVALSGDTLVAGAPRWPAYQGPGAAYVFVKPAAGWKSTSSYAAKLTAADGAVNDYFGYAVALSGGTVVSGAYGATIGSDVQQGAGYVFGRSQ